LEVLVGDGVVMGMLRFGRMRRVWALSLLVAAFGMAQDNRSLGDRTRQYLTDLVRLDTSNPPGNETRVADYLKKVADSFGIQAEEVGSDPKRLNFVARLHGTGVKGRPLLLMAHSDVYPVSPDQAKQWTAGIDPFGAEFKNGYIYGRGTLNAKSLLAAELAVMVEIKRRNLKLSRDVILVSEADGEAGMTGLQWMIQNAWPKIDAEFALNDGGSLLESKEGAKLFGIQTMEKIPMRVILTARGTVGTGALPRPDNPIVHLSDAISSLHKADQPVRVNSTTRRYLRELSTLSDYAWLAPLLPKLDSSATATAAAAQIRAKDPFGELDAMLRTTISFPSSIAGEAQLDVRRMPSETREDVLMRLRQIVNDTSVDVAFAPGPPMPTAVASARTTALYTAMEKAIARIYPRDAVTAAYMSRGATDSGFLRSRGVPVYGVPLFLREPGEPRVRAADERIAPKALDDGVELLWQIVQETAGEN
jgi:acetylornithine deacetylase/succinyl-diaminopimelate desuccinylase-like protein